MADFTDKYIAMANQAASGVIPVGSNIVAYVRSTGQNSSDSSAITSKFYTSLTSALAVCTSGRRDVIIVLPGHSEAAGTTTFTAAATDVRIIGVGNVDEDNAPTVLWSLSGSNWAVASKNITVANMRLIANADGVTNMITVTGAGFKLLNCFIDGGVTSATDATTVVNVSTGGDRCSIIGNDFRATAATACCCVNVSATVDELKLIGNKFVGISPSTTVGLVDIPNAAVPTNIIIAKNYFQNTIAAGTVSLSTGTGAGTGIISDNYFSGLNNGVAAATGYIGQAGGLYRLFQNFNSDEPLKSGALSPVVCAT